MMEDVNTSTQVVRNFDNARILIADKKSDGWHVFYGSSDLKRKFRKSVNGVIIPNILKTKKEVNALISDLGK